MEFLKKIVQFLYDKKEAIAANIIAFITGFAIVLGIAGCVAGDGVVKEIAYCIKNVCNVRGVPVMLDEVKDNVNQ